MTYEQTCDTLARETRSAAAALRKRAWFVGVSMLLTLPLQALLAKWLGPYITKAESTMTLSVANRLLYYALYSAFYCAMLLLPVAICALLFRCPPGLPRTMRRRTAPLHGGLLVLFGMGFCILANYITNYWLMFAQQFGIQPQEGNYHSAAGWLPLLLNLVMYAVLPALVEELVFRGWFLAALQPGGERRALVLSALLFGLAHGNLTQMPFAFLLGLLFGWLYLRTGRLWPSVIVHFLNNSLSVVFDTADVYLAEGPYRVMQFAVYASIVLVGTTAAVLLAVHPAFRTTVRPFSDRHSVIPARRRRRLVWANPALLIALFVYAGLMLLGELVK